MKIVKCVVQAIAPVACGALVLSVVAGDAMAAKKPPVSLLWPSGANLLVGYFPMGIGAEGWTMAITWPIADGADHYRLTVVLKEKQKHASPVVVYDQSPVAYTSSGGVAQLTTSIFLLPGQTYFVILTAYAGPDEAVAHSESLQALIDVPPYWGF